MTGRPGEMSRDNFLIQYGALRSLLSKYPAAPKFQRSRHHASCRLPGLIGGESKTMYRLSGRRVEGGGSLTAALYTYILLPSRNRDLRLIPWYCFLVALLVTRGLSSVTLFSCHRQLLCFCTCCCSARAETSRT